MSNITHNTDIRAMSEYLKALREPKVKLTPDQCGALSIIITDFMSYPETHQYEMTEAQQVISIFMAKTLRDLNTKLRYAKDYNKNATLPITFEVAYSLMIVLKYATAQIISGYNLHKLYENVHAQVSNSLISIKQLPE